jgi:xanthine dehydrogenase accessory factor
MRIWEFIQSTLSETNPVMLIVVLESQGSSPGRQGFMLAAALDGNFYGTIGGGVMEFKLVEKAKVMLSKKHDKIDLMIQYHDKEHSVNQSGMICSGSQVNAFIPLYYSDLGLIQNVIENENQSFQITPNGFSIVQNESKIFSYLNEGNWEYIQAIKERKTVHIIGGGHVSLALSEIMHFLDFYVKVYDDRPNVQTIAENKFADEVILVPSYNELEESISDFKHQYAVIITVGYRDDKIALKQLINKPFTYLGLLGSRNKIEILLEELRIEGYSENLLKQIYTPIGINIHSKTSQEIAISIAAEIILHKNKGNPSARGI